MELNKYGLLPKGMSVEKAQKFVTMLYQGHSNFGKINNYIKFSKSNLTFSNIFCLLLLHCNSTTYNVEFGLLSLPFMFFFALFFIYSFHFYNLKLAFLFLIPTILTAIIGVPALLYNRISPLKLWVIAVIYSYNQAWSIGLMGYKKINNLTLLIGFKGLRIILPDKSGYDIGQAMAISTYPI